MTAICEPIFKFLQKDRADEWNSDCQFFLEDQALLARSSYYDSTCSREATHHVSNSDCRVYRMCVGQHDENDRKEHDIYYLSKTFTDCETKYSFLEKT